MLKYTFKKITRGISVLLKNFTAIIFFTIPISNHASNDPNNNDSAITHEYPSKQTVVSAESTLATEVMPCSRDTMFSLKTRRTALKILGIGTNLYHWIPMMIKSGGDERELYIFMGLSGTMYSLGESIFKEYRQPSTVDTHNIDQKSSTKLQNQQEQSTNKNSIVRSCVKLLPAYFMLCKLIGIMGHTILLSEKKLKKYVLSLPNLVFLGYGFYGDYILYKPTKDDKVCI